MTNAQCNVEYAWNCQYLNVIFNIGNKDDREDIPRSDSLRNISYVRHILLFQIKENISLTILNESEKMMQLYNFVLRPY